MTSDEAKAEAAKLMEYFDCEDINPDHCLSSVVATLRGMAEHCPVPAAYRMVLRQASISIAYTCSHDERALYEMSYATGIHEDRLRLGLLTERDEQRINDWLATKVES